MNTDKPYRPFAYLVLVCLLLLAVAGFFLANSEVVRKGRFLDYTSGRIYEVRFFDSFNLYFEPEIRPRSDTLNAFLLTGMAFSCLTFSVVLAFIGRDTRSQPFWFFFLLFPGLVFLAADEGMGLHESLGHNMPFLAELPLVDRPDDVFILLYALPAGLFLFYFRKVILASQRSWYFFLAAFACFALAAVFDLFALDFEEELEVLSSLLLAMGVVVMGLEQTRAWLRAMGLPPVPPENQ